MKNNRQKRFEAATLWVWLNYLQPGGQERFDYGAVPITAYNIVYFDFSAKDQSEKLAKFIQTMYMPNYYGWNDLSEDAQNRLSAYARGSEMDTFERLFKATPFRKNAQRELDRLYTAFWNKFNMTDSPKDVFHAFKAITKALAAHAKHEVEYLKLKKLGQMSGGLASPQIDMIKYKLLEEEVKWIETEVAAFVELLYRKLHTEFIKEMV